MNKCLEIFDSLEKSALDTLDHELFFGLDDSD